jgi:putative phosphoribosyl transferase
MFEDRRDAGRRLAVRLSKYRTDDLVVVGLAPGGMVVAGEVARALNAPLDVVVVRALRAPRDPRRRIGVIAGGNIPEVVLDHATIATLGVSADYVSDEIQTQLREVRLREALLREGRRALPLIDRTVIVVDDAIVTGTTVRAALPAIRRSGPARLVLAVPVAPAEIVPVLQPLADRVLCLRTPRRLEGAGAFYRDFEGVSAGHVVTLLAEARSAHAIPGVVAS